MFRVTFISDDSISTKLCDSTRNLAEHGFTLNNQRVTQIEPLLGAANSVGFDRKNQRNTVGFSVSRSEDFGGVAFDSPEQALVFAMDHANGAGGASGVSDMGGRGTLQMEFSSSGYSATRYLRNCLLLSVDLERSDLGVCLGLRYQFSGGIIED